METIGFLELNSIAKGVEAADAILKAAETELLFAKPTCPGKYVILFSGEVAAVTAALETGKQTAGRYAVDSVVLPAVDPQVIRGIHLAIAPAAVAAVGVMEFYSITAALYSADAAVKAADVTLMDVRLGTGIGGKSFVVFSGEVAAVRESLNCGLNMATALGMAVTGVVIPNPRKEVFDSLL